MHSECWSESFKGRDNFVGLDVEGWILLERTDLKGTGRENEYRIDLFQNMDQCQATVDALLNFSVPYKRGISRPF
jgi:hypothetical protein